MFRPPLFLLDPVMGDHGRAYSSITETHVQKMKELLPLADIITPNIPEAQKLCGFEIKNEDDMVQAAALDRGAYFRECSCKGRPFDGNCG